MMRATKMFAVFRAAVACNSNIRVYRYAVGQRFGKHIDESVEDENGYLSQWTVLIYLNGGEEGGGGSSVEKAGGGGGDAGATGESGAGGEGAQLRGGETVFYKVGAAKPVVGSAFVAVGEG